MRDPGRHTITVEATDVPLRLGVRRPDDALADPDNDSLIDAALSLWPMGPAWGTPDGMAISLSSVLAGLTRVILDPFVTLYRSAWLLARESSLDGVSVLLADWERDHGLPDACLAGDRSTSDRLRLLAARVMGVRMVTPKDFVRLALDHGFEIAIEEPAIFGCGASECGGEHECGAAREEVFVVLRMPGIEISYFLVSESETGHDRLFDIGAGAGLLCLFLRTLPGWVIPVVAEWRDPYADDPAIVPVVYGGSGFELA